jgi:peptidoglycan-associated lipoprotein
MVLAVLTAFTACKKEPASTPAPAPFPNAPAQPAASPAPASTTNITPPPPPVMAVETPVLGSSDPLVGATLETINKDSPLQPVYFAYDSDMLDDVSQATMAGNAEVLRQYGTWIVTIEGHCDERGTAEYNLALGDRRALAVKNYMVSLGIPADRLRTVSYGKEFPFVPGHDEGAWSRNRRAHFMLTARN